MKIETLSMLAAEGLTLKPWRKHDGSLVVEVSDGKRSQARVLSPLEERLFASDSFADDLIVELIRKLPK